ncbi:MAG: hypothetical protein ACYTXY_36700, partial [Nostoc sp.]
NNFSLPLLLAFTSLNELKTIPCPQVEDFISYLKIIFLFEPNLFWKSKGIVFLFSYFLTTLISSKFKMAINNVKAWINPPYFVPWKKIAR